MPPPVGRSPAIGRDRQDAEPVHVLLCLGAVLKAIPISNWREKRKTARRPSPWGRNCGRRGASSWTSTCRSSTRHRPSVNVGDEKVQAMTQGAVQLLTKKATLSAT